MENASKALLIAGGMLILIILVSIVLLVKANVENYYASENELEMIADTTKFNEQFTRFNRNDVQGYELISLVNKVVDYNERLSEVGNNDVGAKKIVIELNLCNSGFKTTLGSNETDQTDTKIFQLAYDNVLRLFTSNPIKQSDNKNKFETILKDVAEIENSNKYISILIKKIKSIQVNSSLNRYPYAASGWSKNKDSISDEQKNNDKEKMIKAIREYQTAVGNSSAYKPNSNSYDDVSNAYQKMLYEKKTGEKYNNIEKMYRYYEYTQFKKAYFKCTKVEYDSSTGRVNELNFAFTGKIE